MARRKVSTLERDSALIDVSAVVLLVALYVGAEALAIPKRWLFAAILLCLALFAWHIARRNDERLRDFGLRADRLLEGLAAISLWTLLAATGICIYAYINGKKLWHADMAYLLPLYPLYGIVQQLIFQAVLHRRLLVLLKRERSSRRVMAAMLTTLVFALSHIGSLPLVLLTAGCGLVWSLLYQRWPNIYLLGISHGILASLAYPLLLGEQALSRI